MFGLEDGVPCGRVFDIASEIEVVQWIDTKANSCTIGDKSLSAKKVGLVTAKKQNKRRQRKITDTKNNKTLNRTTIALVSARRKIGLFDDNEIPAEHNEALANAEEI